MYEEILSELLDQANENIKKAAKECLEDTQKVVPVDTGNLKSTGKVVETSEGIAIVYDADYALEVHENPEGRGYKFVERTVNQNMPKYMKIIGGE